MLPKQSRSAQSRDLGCIAYDRNYAGQALVAATSEFSSCVITRHPSNVENVLLDASIRYNIKEQSLKLQKQETPCDSQAVYR